jgi:hypothetical protein
VDSQAHAFSGAGRASVSFAAGEVFQDSSDDDEDKFFSASVEIICTDYRSLDTPKHGGWLDPWA